MSYEVCFKTGSILEITFSEEGEKVSTFAALPAETLNALLNSSVNEESPDLFAANLENVKRFTMQVSQSNLVMKGIDGSGQITDVRRSEGKPILVFDGTLDREVRDVLEQQLTVIDQERVTLKQEDKEFAVEQIDMSEGFMQGLFQGQFNTVQWQDIFVRNDPLAEVPKVLRGPVLGEEPLDRLGQAQELKMPGYPLGGHFEEPGQSRQALQAPGLHLPGRGVRSRFWRVSYCFRAFLSRDPTCLRTAGFSERTHSLRRFTQRV